MERGPFFEKTLLSFGNLANHKTFIKDYKFVGSVKILFMEKDLNSDLYLVKYRLNNLVVYPVYTYIYNKGSYATFACFTTNILSPSQYLYINNTPVRSDRPNSQVIENRLFLKTKEDTSRLNIIKNMTWPSLHWGR